MATEHNQIEFYILIEYTLCLDHSTRILFSQQWWNTSILLTYIIQVEPINIGDARYQ